MIDLLFSVTGSVLPSDHAHALFSAISHERPFFHTHKMWGLHTVTGIPLGDGKIRLDQSRFGFRIEENHIQEALHLMGRTLNILGTPIEVGAPLVFPLVPAARLVARIVTLSGVMEAEAMQKRANEIIQSYTPDAQVFVGRRRIVRIRGSIQVGYSLEANGLTPEASLQLQKDGIGGKRHFGCGLFRVRQNILVPDLKEVA